MQFEWDVDKAKANKTKHGVSFELAQSIWDDPLHLVIPDAVHENEQRWLAIGSVSAFTVLVAAYVYRDKGGNDIVRIISARRATPHERKRYEQENS